MNQQLNKKNNKKNTTFSIFAVSKFGSFSVQLKFHLKFSLFSFVTLIFELEKSTKGRWTDGRLVFFAERRKNWHRIFIFLKFISHQISA